jgi:hypothetical protein
MKPEPAPATAQDRLATWEEIRHATSKTPDQVLEQCYTNQTYCEIESDLGGKIQYAAEEFEFYAYLSELDRVNVN